jgi:hypothetical protein
MDKLSTPTSDTKILTGWSLKLLVQIRDCRHPPTQLSLSAEILTVQPQRSKHGGDREWEAFIVQSADHNSIDGALSAEGARQRRTHQMEF